MASELLERQKHFNSLIPGLVESYLLVPSSESAESSPIETHTLSPLFGQLRDDFWQMLPTSDVEQAASHDALVRATARCSQLLEQRRKEIRDFVNVLCLHVVNIQVRGELHPEAARFASASARRDLLAAVEQVFVPIEPILTADLMPQPLPVVQDAVQNWLKTATHNVASQFVLALHALVESDVVGIIEWTSEQVCKLHYFRHTVIQGRVTTHKTSIVERIERDTLTIEETEKLRARNRYTVERHEHHVMNAEALKLEQTRLPIPQKYNDLINRIPEWLRPQVRILEGDLFLEHAANRLIRQDEWETERIVRNTYKIDPAILLGHYVLSGWGEQEVDREIHRQRREQSIESPPTGGIRTDDLRESQKLLSLSNATSAAAVTMMLFSRLQPRVMVPLSLLLSLIAVVTLVLSHRARSRASSQGVDLIFVACRIGTTAFGLVGVQSALFGLLFGSWSMLGLALPLILVAVVTGSLAAARRPA